MKCRIEIDMDNAAFQEGLNGDELYYILDNLALYVQQQQLNKASSRSLQDTNGNTVGTFTIEGD